MRVCSRVCVRVHGMNACGDCGCPRNDFGSLDIPRNVAYVTNRKLSRDKTYSLANEMDHFGIYAFTMPRSVSAYVPFTIMRFILFGNLYDNNHTRG